MKKTLALLAVVGCLAIAGSAFATLPCAANSSCAIEVQNGNGCTTADLRWCPAGDMDHIIIRVTVRNCLDDPLEGCVVRLDLSGQSDAMDGTSAMGVCGTMSSTATSDANGAVAFDLTGGGCGRFVLDWTATAECADPEVELCANSTELCAKSPDFNGDLTINFFDTFKFLPALNAGTGYCADFNCDNVVNFFDTFQFLPHLNHGGGCVGWTLTDAALGTCPLP
ncbi:MAG: hypothetical protein ABIK65_03245 [Candidatus Eisenbacteria bacterium]